MVPSPRPRFLSLWRQKPEDRVAKHYFQEEFAGAERSDGPFSRCDGGGEPQQEQTIAGLDTKVTLKTEESDLNVLDHLDEDQVSFPSPYDELKN